MAEIRIDGTSYEVREGDNLLHAVLSLGLDLPYFCWHPALGSVGACRQCAVKQFKDDRDSSGRIVMACMTPAAEGTRIAIDDPEARRFRSEVIEWLMTSHPHDCPVCDEGGECHLQDMTVMTGHDYRRFRFRKRTFENQYLGPFVNHEMNRCITCYRCVRFYRDYAGGCDLDAFAAHHHVYFGRHRDGVLESEFSGNLVEVCPTGVFTDRTLKQHYTRKWDLESAPSICPHCAIGCNILAAERHGALRRILNRYSYEVNGYFLCDRGRFGYEFVNRGDRVRSPWIRRGADRGTLDAAEAVQYAAALLGGRRVLGIGSPRASLESNFALRQLVGPENFHRGDSAEDEELVGAALALLRGGAAPLPSLREVEEHDAVLVLGEDVPNTAPRLALSLRQAALRQPREFAERHGVSWWNDAAWRELAQDRTGPFFVLTPCASRLDRLATETVRGAPEDLARVGFAVARALDPRRPRLDGLGADESALVARIAASLRDAARPLVVSGTGAGSRAVLEAASAVAHARSGGDRGPASLHLVVPECDHMGLALLGGGSLSRAFERVRDGAVDTVIVLENDLYRRADREAVDDFVAGVPHLIALDHFEHGTSVAAELCLPAATFAEGDGTLVSSECRAQRFFQAIPPADGVCESWRWLGRIARACGDGGWDDLEAIDRSLGEVEGFRPLEGAATVPRRAAAARLIPRAPHRYSGRTAIEADRTVHEPPPPRDPDSPLVFSMEGAPIRPSSPIAPFYRTPGWNSVQALNKFQSEVGGRLRGGHPGCRLLPEPTGNPPAPGAARIPSRLARRGGEWRIVPLHHVFGTEELSARAPGIAELAPARAYVALRPDEAESLDLAEGEAAELRIGNRRTRLPVRLRSDLPPGVAGVAAGLADLPYLRLDPVEPTFAAIVPLAVRRRAEGRS